MHFIAALEEEPATNAPEATSTVTDGRSAPEMGE